MVSLGRKFCVGLGLERLGGWYGAGRGKDEGWRRGVMVVKKGCGVLLVVRAFVCTLRRKRWLESGSFFEKAGEGGEQ